MKPPACSALLAFLLCFVPATEYRSSGQSLAAESVTASTLPPANLVYGTTRYFNQLTRLVHFTVADINGDGVLDLIGPQFEESNIAICLGDPAHPGTFLEPTFVPTHSTTVDSVTVADLNGDGFPDLVFGDSDSHGAAILLQDASHPGSFLPAYYAGATQARPLVADMNHDGVPDLILFPSDFSQYASSNVAILLGDPAHRGSFLPPTLFPLVGNDISSVAVADMNADGLPDIVVGNDNAQSVSIFINDVAHPGSLLPRHDYAAHVSIFDLAVGDLNGDGYPDVVLGGVFSGVGVLLGNPSQPGALLPISTYGVTMTSAGGRSLGIALGDVNGDGKLDVVSGNLGPSFDLLLGNGDGTLATAMSYRTGPTPDTFESDSMAIADVDADGSQDVLVGQFYQNSVQVFAHRSPLPSLAITATDQTLSTDVVNPGSPLTITVRVSAFQGTPQGSVTLYDSGGGATYIPLATLLLDATGTAIYTTTALQPIFHDFITHFPGDGIYAPSTSLIDNVVVTSNPTVTMTLSGSPNPGVLGQDVILTATIPASNPAPTGDIVFLDSGTMIGSAPLNSSGVAVFNTSSLVLGVHSLVAVYLGDGHYVSQQASVNETIRYPAAQLTITSSLNPAIFGQPVTFKIAASASGPTPTGSVGFQDNGAALLQVPLGSDATASLTTAALTVGNHVIRAIYAGDANYAAESAMLTEGVVAVAPPPPAPGDYTLTPGASLTLGMVRAGTVTLSTTPLNGFIDTVTLSCGSLPAYVTCRSLPSSVTFIDGTPQQTAIQIAIDQSPGSGGLQLAGRGFVIASVPLLCLVLPLQWRRRIPVKAWLFSSLLLLAVAGCGFSKSPLTTPAGTYSITIAGHGTSTHLDRSTVVTLIVQ